MEKTDSYVVVEQMIRQGELKLSELEHLLDALVEKEQITRAEQQALLELGWEVNMDQKPAT